MDELIPLIRERLEAGQTVKFSPKGISMLPMLRQGRDSVVLAKPPERLRKYDVPLYVRPDGKYLLHRVIAVEQDNRYTCMGDNLFEREEGILHSEVIAVVVAFTRDSKMIPVSRLSYRLYCRFWYAVKPFRRLLRGVKNRLSRLFRVNRDENGQAGAGPQR